MNDKEIEEMINLGRLLNLLVAIQYPEQMGEQNDLKFEVVPHKLRKLGSIDVVLGH